MADHQDYETGAAPAAHKTSHQDAGTDEISIAGLSGVSESLLAHSLISAAHHVKYTDAEAVLALADLLSAKASKTTANFTKSVGSGGDYATWTSLLAAIPDLISHTVSITIKAGETIPALMNVNGLLRSSTLGLFKISAEKYFPTTGDIPTADSATATTLRDAALSAAALGDDYFNGCWVFISDGTGTDNGFVSITDYVDATGDITVASWPGTQPDNTSRYIIVGALVDGSGTAISCAYLHSNSCPVVVSGIGFKDSYTYNVHIENSSLTSFYYCGSYSSERSGFYVKGACYADIRYCGSVDNNTDNIAYDGGLRFTSGSSGFVYKCGISDNDKRGILVENGAHVIAQDCFGDNNGDWGTYAQRSGQAYCPGTECSGSSGDHSNGAGDGSLAY